MQSKAIRQEDRGWRAPAQGDQSDALSRTRSHPDALSHTQTRSDALRCTQTHSDALTSSMRLSIHSICTIWLVSIGVYLAFLLPSSKQSMSLAT